MFHAILSTIGPEWLWHPLGLCVGHHAEVVKCKSYNFHSGIEGNIPLIGMFVSILVAMWRVYKHVECDVESPRNCHRIGHRVPGTAHFACHTHHPHAEEKGNITVEDIHRHHKEANKNDR